MSGLLTLVDAAIVILQIVAIPFALLNLSTLRPFLRITSRTRALERYYGLPVTLLLNFFVRDTWCVQAEVLSSESPSLAEDYRKAYIDECNMTAITGALVATIAVTAFAVPNLRDTHWTARGFLVSSLILSLTSVFTASKLYKMVGRLLRPEQLRAFIGVEMDVVLGAATFGKLDTLLTMVWPWYVNQDAVISRSSLVHLPSAIACLLLSIPRLMFAASLVSFVLALGAYTVGLVYLDLPTRDVAVGDYYVVIFYTVALTVCFVLYDISSSLLSGRIVGRQDPGDSIMCDLAKRRAHVLEARGMASEVAYLQWRRRRQAARSEDGDRARGDASRDDKVSPVQQQTKSMSPATTPDAAMCDHQVRMVREEKTVMLMQEATRLASEQTQLFKQLVIILNNERSRG